MKKLVSCILFFFWLLAMQMLILLKAIPDAIQSQNPELLNIIFPELQQELKSFIM